MLNCFLCDKDGFNFSLLKHHVRSRHVTLGETQFKCKQENCSRIFSSIRSLYCHISAKHITKPSNVSECNLNVPSSSAFSIVDLVNDQDISESSSNCVNEVKLEHEMNLGNKSELAFVLKLYNQINLTLEDIDKIILNTDQLLQCKDNIGDEIHFKMLKTNYQRRKHLTELNLYTESEQIVLGYKYKLIKCKDKYVGKNVPVTGQYTSIGKIIKIIFSCSDNVSIATEYMLHSNESILEDLKDGSQFKNFGRNVFPYVLFYDELESGNPLGSHKGCHKIGAIYFSFRCFPTYTYSSLKNIFQCFLFPSKNKNYLNVVLDKLAVEIKKLYNDGLQIGSETFYFQFCGFIGDNLGLHQVLGFVESFNAHYICRFCKANKESTRRMTKEDAELLRNIENYEEDLALGDVSLSGIKSDSILNSLPKYHVTKNVFVDVMHDVLEGVANFGLCSVILFYVNNNVFSLDELNGRIRLFPFGNKENRPPLIKIADLLKNDLAMSAAEILNLVTFFSLIMGDRIPLNCAVWAYYLALQEIVSILVWKSIPLSYVPVLENLISEHHQMYKILFQRHLRPKHHFMIHYGMVIRRSGPLCHNWSMRFESKHFSSKIYATVCRSRINICKSMAVRHNYVLAHDAFTIHKEKITDVCRVGPALSGTDPLFYKWVTYKGNKFSVGDFLCSGETALMPLIFKIVNISINRTVLLTLDMIKVQHFNQHLNAYAVDSTIVLETNSVSMDNVSSPLVTFCIGNFLYVMLN